jgi:hypothetical protein
VLLWALFWALVDRFAALPPRARFGTSVVAGLLVFVVLARSLARLLFGRMDYAGVAGLVEHLRPEFGQLLLTTTSQFLSRPEMRGSPVLLESLLSDTRKKIALIRPAQLIPMQAITSAWLGTAGAALLMSLLLLLPWLDLPTLLARQLRPFASIGAVSTTRLSVEPGNISLVQRQPLTISARAQRLGSGSVLLVMSSGTEPATNVPMIRDGEEKFTFTLSSVERDARYQVVGGDARSELYTIRVLRRPSVAQFQIHYTYPAYLKRAAQDVVNTTGQIDAPAGTMANVTVVADEPLRTAAFVVGEKRFQGAANDRPDARVVAIPVMESGEYRLELTSAAGIRMIAPFVGVIRAIRDEPPRLSLLLPEISSIATHGSITVPYVAQDDHGLVMLAFEIRSSDGELRSIPLAMTEHPENQLGSETLSAAAMRAAPGDVVTISLAGSDAAGQPGHSERALIYVSDAGADAHAINRVAALRSAALMASRAAADMEHVRVQTEAARQRGEIIVPDVARLARAGESAGAIIRNLLRATLHSGSPQLSTALATLADRAEVLAGDTAQLRAAAEQFVPPERRAQQVAKVAGSALSLRASLDEIWRGEQAKLLLARRQDIAAITARAAASTQPESLNRLADAMSRAIESGQRDLGIQVQHEEMTSRLKSDADTGDRLASSQQPVDFAGASAQWSADPQTESNLAARLETASTAEALRPDSNATRSRDLLLAANATRSLTRLATTRPAMSEVKDLPKAVESMLGDKDVKAANDARERLRGWALMSPDESNATSQAKLSALDAATATADRAYDQAASADQRLQQAVTAMSLHVNQAAGARSAQARSAQMLAEARQLDALMDRQKKLQERTAATQPSPELAHEQEMLAAEAEKLRDAAAAASIAPPARRAVDALSAGRADSKPTAIAEQSAAIAALSAAWLDAVRATNLARISGLPSMAAFFKTDAVVDATFGPSDQPALNSANSAITLAPRGAGQVNTAPQLPDPAGYQESLRVYFNALNRQRSASPERP